MQNYDLLIERISKLSGISKQEVEQRIEAKKAKLSGLISKEGAAQIIAAELGVNLDNVPLKISELMVGMKKVNLIGKIINLFPVKEYNKNNKQGKIGSFILADQTGNLRVVLWDTNHIELIENNKINVNDVVEIKNGAMRENELHLSGFSEIKKSNLMIENVKVERDFCEKEIIAIQQGQNVTIRAVVVQMFNPRFFNVCPECGKKAVEESDGFKCDAHGKVSPKERALVNIVLDDGSETIRAVLFSDHIQKIAGNEDLKDPEKISAFRDNLLGEELIIKGLVKKNQLFNNLELSVSDLNKANVDDLIQNLEA
ncbi:MAG: hypothetical protein ACOYT4_04420 [Nanoarchaeota archaeon]